MTTPPDDDATPRRRALYLAQADATDPATRETLRAFRRAALARGEGPAAGRRLASPWWSAAAFATVAMAAVLLVPREAPTPAPTVGDRPAATATAVDASAQADAAGLEFDNDAEFYAWLADAPPAGDDGSAWPDDDAPPPGPEDGWTL